MTALDKQAIEWLFANGWAVNEDPPYSCWWHPATDEYGVKEIDLPVVLAAFATQVREQTVAECSQLLKDVIYDGESISAEIFNQIAAPPETTEQEER